ncbi:hypothetical protein EXIGLDRAFT_705457 [Exidia glandulosa HHB12029]|uniref:phosphoribosyl-AMP cyclohydrolase n=1 Tax=Exidia glandulosa HHB12029 TaxID=1314781 RepID=A0A165KK29_EXIGL|nr:hypothetical protein EXIGLDRAFT_705457 [Exidia glandulosa HHB12029]
MTQQNDDILSSFLQGGKSLGLVYSSRESVAEPIATGRGVYQSRKHGMWRKGETSGDVWEIVSIGHQQLRRPGEQRYQLGLAAFCSGIIREAQASLQGQRLPIHTHINTDLLEAAFLISCMLRGKAISKPFHRLLDFSDRQIFTGPRRARDHIMQASKALQDGEWKKCRNLIQSIKIWSLMPEEKTVKGILARRIQEEEGLRTLLFTYYEQLYLATGIRLVDVIRGLMSFRARASRTPLILRLSNPRNSIASRYDVCPVSLASCRSSSANHVRGIPTSWATTRAVESGLNCTGAHLFAMEGLLPVLSQA